MNAVVVRVTINDRESATQGLREQVVPRVSQAPGFVAGYWTRKEGTDTGLSMILFESEDAANSAVEQLRGTAPEGVVIDDIEVREVVEHA
jgi:heme-degrading monooxygenase HmoA